MKLSLSVVVLLVVAEGAAASGKTEYIPPPIRSLDATSPENVRTYNIEPESAWLATIKYLSTSFFTLDQVLKDSSLVNLSFTVNDPPRYIECGRITSWVKNLRGRRDYSFEAASAHEQYETWPLKAIERTITLAGKINVFLSKETGGVRVSVTTKYEVQKYVTATAPFNYEHPPQHLSSTLTFKTGENGRDEYGTVCQSTFVLERQILDGIQLELAQDK